MFPSHSAAGIPWQYRMVKTITDVQDILTCGLCFLNEIFSPLSPASSALYRLLLKGEYRRWVKFLFPRESTASSGTVQPCLTGMSCGCRGHKKDPFPQRGCWQSPHYSGHGWRVFPLLCRWCCSCFSNRFSKRCWTNIQLSRESMWMGLCLFFNQNQSVDSLSSALYFHPFWHIFEQPFWRPHF